MRTHTHTHKNHTQIVLDGRFDAVRVQTLIHQDQLMNKADSMCKLCQYLKTQM